MLKKAWDYAVFYSTFTNVYFFLIFVTSFEVLTFLISKSTLFTSMERHVNVQRHTEDETKTEIETSEQQDMRKHEENADTAAAAVNMWTKQQKQQQQRQQADKVNSSQTETTLSKKRNLPTAENVMHEDVSSWPYFMYVLTFAVLFLTDSHRIISYYIVDLKRQNRLKVGTDKPIS